MHLSTTTWFIFGYLGIVDMVWSKSIIMEKIPKGKYIYVDCSINCFKNVI